MDDTKSNRSSLSILDDESNKRRKPFDIAIPSFFVQIPQRLQNCLKSHFKNSVRDDRGANSVLTKQKDMHAALELDLDKQLKVWKDNPTWVDQPPDIKVSVPKGSLCNLNVKVKVGLPPDAVYNIVTDPDNRRVFKNIKEVISRRVLLDEGSRQVVEVEQAALWRFLWWSGTIAVHVIVDQNREDYSMKFKQVKTGFMKRFEGCWRVEPLFVDEKMCFPLKPKTWADYDSCTGGKGRVGSIVRLEQLIQPALVPPPPISWYLRGITTRTTEMLILDLLAEAARIRGGLDLATANFDQKTELSEGVIDESLVDVKARWAHRRRNARRYKNHKRFLEQ
ncbi:Protein of unknown function DUF220 [Macleaya cordata]|uniref:DUF220 domain-containing protein n=1 Tax=Macleaya cordata TaxID=56857 RepID=A0A200R2Q5_MACCD|nr:Protein of unknown function DUF220 [Macleaya cordata]